MSEYAGKFNKISAGSEEMTVLEEAAKVVMDRGQSYGSPELNHGRIAKAWSAYLSGKLKSEITAREVCLMQILLKVMRDAHTEKRDNLVDIAGYARNGEMVG